jgi:hypothetical protein
MTNLLLAGPSDRIETAIYFLLLGWLSESDDALNDGRYPSIFGIIDKHAKSGATCGVLL